MTFTGALVAVTALFAFGLAPVAANAAGVGSVAELQDALSPGTDSVITLTANAQDSNASLTVDRDVTIDFSGYTLQTDSLTVTAGHTLTLVGDSGFRVYMVNVDGTLQLGSDLSLQPYAVVSVGATGKIESDSTPRTIGGAQDINNAGTITAQITPGQRVTGNNFSVRFVDNLASDDFQDVQVYAPTLQAAGLAIPAFPRVHATIAAWNSESDGSGTAFSATTPLSNWSTYYAQWVADGITSFQVSYEGDPLPARAGSISLIATDTSPGNVGGEVTDLVEFSSSNPVDTIGASVFSSWLNAERAGDRVVTGMLRGAQAVYNSVTVPVMHTGFPAEINLAMTPTAVVSGGTSLAYLSALDEYGNRFSDNLIVSDECDYCEVTLSSSDPSDLIDPDTGRITFTTLGKHTITATVNIVEGGSREATAIVNVTAVPAVTVPKPPMLVNTGSAPTFAPGAALLLALLGFGMLVAGRRRA